MLFNLQPEQLWNITAETQIFGDVASDEQTQAIQHRLKTQLNKPQLVNLYRWLIKFNLYEAVSILLDLDPFQEGNHTAENFRGLERVLEQHIESGDLQQSKIKIKQHKELGEIKEITITRQDLITFAKRLGLEPPTFQDLPKPANETTANQNGELLTGYSEKERETHLQLIFLLSDKLAKSNISLQKGEGNINASRIAAMLKTESRELFTNPKKPETYRKIINEAIKHFSD